jgi:uncharacterized protein (DUF934 family)
MPLLEDGRLVPDAWVSATEDAPLPAGAVIVPLDRLEQAATRNAPLGVSIGNDVSVEALAPWLPRLSLVQVVVPKSKDGRAFSQIRALREYHGFAGEIRVAGHVIPDHYAMLLRCGASTVVVPDGAESAVWEASRHVVSIAYQHAQSAETPLALLRRKVA